MRSFPVRDTGGQDAFQRIGGEGGEYRCEGRICGPALELIDNRYALYMTAGLTLRRLGNHRPHIPKSVDDIIE